MINWPHVGLYGEFSNCEEGILEALNRNFFLIDSILQMKVISFVENLPSSPNQGDIYIVEDSTYTYTSGSSYIMIWNGFSWQQVIPKAGFIAWVSSQENFFYYNGIDWLILPKTIGDVSGPSSSLNNSIARFDGTTGKFITYSGVTIDNDNVISGLTGIYADAMVSSSIYINELNVSSENNNTAGPNLPAPSYILTRLTGTITSIDSISAPSNGKTQIHIYENMTGNAISIKNSATVRTGTGSDLDLEDGASVYLVYSDLSSQWIVVGGSGSGSGVMIVADIAARNNIPENKRKRGMLVQVISEDQIYKLIGLPLGATTTDANWDAAITSKATQVITAKDIDGGTASNTSRHTTPKDDIEALHLLNRKEGTQLFDTYTKSLIIDDGTKLKAVPKFEKLDVFFQDRAQLEKLSDWTQNLSGITSSFTKVANNPELGDAYLLDITSSTGDAGGAYTLRKDIAVPERFRNQTVSISMDYVSDINTGGANLMIVDQTNSVNLVAEDNVQSPIAPMAVKAKKIVTFQVPATCATLRLFIGKTITNTTAISNKKISFNNIELGLATNNIVDVYNSVDMKNMGPTVWAASTTAPTKGTTVKDKVLLGRDGQYLVGIVEYKQSTAGSVGSGLYYLDLSAQMQAMGAVGFDTNLISLVTDLATSGASTIDGGQTLGLASLQLASNQSMKGNVVATSTTRIAVHALSIDTGTGSGVASFNSGRTMFSYASGSFSCHFRIPISNWTGKTANIIQEIDTFDSSRNPLVWSGTAITAASPIGTVNTFTFASGTGNVPTLATTRPTQTDAEFMTQGLRLYSRGAAASTATEPVMFKIMVGKGFKGTPYSFLNGFKDTSKSIAGLIFTDEWVSAGDAYIKRGALCFYNPVTGIMTINAGMSNQTTSVSAFFEFEDLTEQNNIYITISASKNPALAGLNAPARQIVKTFRSGYSWYEVCNDGWVRQGDYYNTGTDGSKVITYGIPMRDAQNIVRTQVFSSSSGTSTWDKVGHTAESATTLTMWAGSTLTKQWSVEGYGDSAAVKALGANPNY